MSLVISSSRAEPGRNERGSKFDLDDYNENTKLASTNALKGVRRALNRRTLYFLFISFLVPIRDDDENKQFENTLMVMMIAC